MAYPCYQSTVIVKLASSSSYFTKFVVMACPLTNRSQLASRLPLAQLGADCSACSSTSAGCWTARSSFGGCSASAVPYSFATASGCCFACLVGAGSVAFWVDFGSLRVLLLYCLIAVEIDLIIKFDVDWHSYDY